MRLELRQKIVDEVKKIIVDTAKILLLGAILYPFMIWFISWFFMHYFGYSLV